MLALLKYSCVVRGWCMQVRPLGKCAVCVPLVSRQQEEFDNARVMQARICLCQVLPYAFRLKFVGCIMQERLNGEMLGERVVMKVDHNYSHLSRFFAGTIQIIIFVHNIIHITTVLLILCLMFSFRHTILVLLFSLIDCIAFFFRSLPLEPLITDRSFQEWPSVEN
jgi:hypothetical protein